MSLQCDRVNELEDELCSGQVFACGSVAIANNLPGSAIGLPADYAEKCFISDFFWQLSCASVASVACLSSHRVAPGYKIPPDCHERSRLMASQNFMGRFLSIRGNERLFPGLLEGARVLVVITGVVVAVAGAIAQFFVVNPVSLKKMTKKLSCIAAKYRH